MIELDIQKYLRSGKTLIDLTLEYNIKYFTSIKHPNLVVFDYTALSPKTESIVREARGLVLEADTWNLVSKSMNAFSYKNDGVFSDVVDNFDWTTAKAYPKYDGCLINLYHYKGEWITGTRFSVDGLCNVASAYKGESDISWRDLFIQCLEFINIDFNSFVSTLNPDYCYSFELCSIINRNIVIYENKFVKLLAIYDTFNDVEVDIHSNPLINQNWASIVPYFIKVESIQEIEDLLALNQDPTQNEGLVIVDSNFNRIKVRNPNFDRLSYNMNPKDESDALKQLFFSILLATSPSSSTTPTITTYCYYDLNGNGSCSNPSSPPPGSSGPYDACGTGIFDCVLVTFCWYDILPPYTRPSLCIPSGYSPPANYAGGTGICGIDACVNPLDGGGGGPMSVQSSNEFTISNVCGSSFNPKAIKLNNQITSDFVAMCNWIISEYKKYKSGDEQSKIKIIEIWQKAFVSLENNQPITSLISIDLIDECKDAINRYNCLLNINVN
jgi:hypothetical protein